MRNILSILFATFITIVSNAQNLNILSQKVIGGAQSDALGVYPSPMGDGYFLIGTSNSNISGDKTENSRGGYDIWILKTDNNFNILWDKTIGGDLDDRLTSANIIDNKIYIAANSQSTVSGEKTSNNFGSLDIWTICLDLNGNILWQNQFGGTDGESSAKIIEYKINSILIVCSSESLISGNKTVLPHGGEDIWILEVEKLTGQILTQKNIGSTDDDQFPFVLKSATNNHVYLTCHTFGMSAGASGDKTDPGFDGFDIWLVEMDENLNIIQDKCFGGTSTDEFPSIIEIENNIFLLAQSRSDSLTGNKTAPYRGGFYSDGWLLKLDLNLNITWDKSFGGTADDRILNLHKNYNGNLVLSLISQSIPSGNKTSPRFGMFEDSWLVITDPNGNILAQETYGGIAYDVGDFIKTPSSVSELLLVAYTESGISGNKNLPSKGGGDCWLARIDASNFLNTTQLDSGGSTISVYPNPFVNELNFDFSNLNEVVQLYIYSIDGKLITKIEIPNATKSFVWRTKENEEMFFYKIVGSTINHSGKIIKL